jgi:hypothetical protein
MAVAFDAASELPMSTSQNPSWTHTPSGTPTGVGIIVVYRDANGASTITINSVTYGVETCDFEDSQDCNSGLIRVALYSLPSPPSGQVTVQVNFNAVPDRNSTAYVVTVTGGDTANVFSAVAKATATSTAPSVSVASSADELVMDGVASAGSLNAVGEDQTVRMNASFVANLSSGEACGSTKAGAVSVTTSWTLSGSTDWGIISASFAVASASPSRIMFRGS